MLTYKKRVEKCQYFTYIFKFCVQVLECGWSARRAPSLVLLYTICRNMYLWLQKDPNNVCAIHCLVRLRFLGGSNLNLLSRDDRNMFDC